MNATAPIGKTRHIAHDVLAVLSTCVTIDRSLRIDQQLDRSLYTRVNAVLEALGGKWVRKERAHLFNSDARELVEAVLVSGEVVLPADFGFFPTPRPLVDLMLEIAQIERGQRVLEPSAGDGAIAIALWKRRCDVECIEVLPKNVETLRAAFRGAHNVTVNAAADFLRMLPAPIFDRVVMNPPFAKRADIHHISHAYRFLKPGGRLVAIASAGVIFRRDALATSFREFVARHAGTIAALPDGSFEESGTSVRTALVRIEA